MTHPVAAVAREAIAAHLEGRRYRPPALPAPWTAAQPVFVSLHDPSGELRGCIGHLSRTCGTLAEEVAAVAVLAATEDPRFPPVDRAELDGLSVEVSVLNDPVPIPGPEALDPRRYGVVVHAGRRRGVLLPDLEGIDTVAEQLAIARRKAGISPHEAVSLERFEVTKLR